MGSLCPLLSLLALSTLSLSLSLCSLFAFSLFSFASFFIYSLPYSQLFILSLPSLSQFLYSIIELSPSSLLYLCSPSFYLPHVSVFYFFHKRIIMLVDNDHPTMCFILISLAVHCFGK